MAEKRTPLPLIGAIIAVFGAILSLLLICSHMFPTLCGAEGVCTVGGIDGCRALGESPYSRFLGLIPYALLGFVFYLVAAILFFGLHRLSDASKRPGYTAALAAMTVFGTVVNLYLAWINFVTMPVPCLLCSYTYITMLGSVAIALILYFKVYPPVGDPFQSILALKLDIAKAIAIAVALAVAVVVVMTFLGGSSRERDREVEANLPFLEQALLRGQSTLEGNLLREVEGMARDLRHMRSVDLDESSLVAAIDGAGDGAYISIHAWGDFRCPHCGTLHQQIAHAKQRWPGRIRAYYRHFPLDGSCNRLIERPQDGSLSCNGALAALCGTRQSDALFPELVDALFDYQRGSRPRPLTPDNIRETTERLGGDWAQLRSCMGSEWARNALELDIADAATLNLRATPALTVAGHFLGSGAPDRRYFINLIDALVYEREGAAAIEELEGRLRR